MHDYFKENIKICTYPIEYFRKYLDSFLVNNMLRKIDLKEKNNNNVHILKNIKIHIRNHI